MTPSRTSSKSKAATKNVLKDKYQMLNLVQVSEYYITELGDVKLLSKLTTKRSQEEFQRRLPHLITNQTLKRGRKLFEDN